MKKIFFLQLGLAFALIYAGIDALGHPFDWVGFVPHWVTLFGLGRTMALNAHSVVEIILGLWLLTGWKLKLAAWLTALDMLVILVIGGFDRGVFLITFRDVSLLLTSVYLAVADER